MKVSITLCISALVTLCAAQFGLPDCAQKCVTDAKLPAQCGQLDIACICSSNEWLSNLSCCISDNCPPKDQADTIVAAQGLCKGCVLRIPQLKWSFPVAWEEVGYPVLTTSANSGYVTLASTLPPCATATAASSKTDSSSSSATAGAASGSSSASAAGSSTSVSSSSASSSALPSNAAGQPGAAAASPATPTSTGAANQLTVSGMGAVGIACAAIGLL